MARCSSGPGTPAAALVRVSVAVVAGGWGCGGCASGRAVAAVVVVVVPGTGGALGWWVGVYMPIRRAASAWVRGTRFRRTVSALVMACVVCAWVYWMTASWTCGLF